MPSCKIRLRKTILAKFVAVKNFPWNVLKSHSTSLFPKVQCINYIQFIIGSKRASPTWAVCSLFPFSKCKMADGISKLSHFFFYKSWASELRNFRLDAIFLFRSHHCKTSNLSFLLQRAPFFDQKRIDTFFKWRETQQAATLGKVFAFYFGKKCLLKGRRHLFFKILSSSNFLEFPT